MLNTPQQAKRDRGLVLTEKGQKKLNDAIWKTFAEEYNNQKLSALSQRTPTTQCPSGITDETVAKILSHQKGVDEKSLRCLFNALGLKLEKEDRISAAQIQPLNFNEDALNALVQDIRGKIKPSIKERCGTMRVLDMSHPIALNDIYTTVNILEKITAQRRKKITQLRQECKLDNFERFGLGRINEKRVLGLGAVKKYSKLIILGKPGAGKTTFLKSVAIQCIEGELQAEQVPIFITLKDFAEATNKPGLLEYIDVWRRDCCLPHQSLVQDAQPTNISITENLLIQGRMLILLDGLDEVREEDSSRVLKEIRDFSGRFCDNRFVMTCRIAAKKYTFDKFTEVEVADFNNKQIFTFATNWFKNKPVKSETFIQHLQAKKTIQELATNPLLLTLLCLVFEETGNFPANRSELYKEGLDNLLKKWDAKRGIERKQVYKKLSFQRKEDLLSKIAFATFKSGDYFFKQKIAEQYITQYICNLPDASTAPEALQLDSEQVLKSFEAQHGLLVERAKGIYSFSHLTFHEYFTAREIVVRTQPLGKALQNLVSHITEKRWREVFVLSVGMLQPSADRLLQLMKQQVDAIIAVDNKLQQFLRWVNEKSLSIETPCKQAARAYYLIVELNITRVLNDLLVLDIAPELAVTLGIDPENDFDDSLLCEYALTRVLDLAISLITKQSNSECCPMPVSVSIKRRFSNKIVKEFCYAFFANLDLAVDQAYSHELRQSIQQLKDKIPQLVPERRRGNLQDVVKFLGWMKAEGIDWLKQLRAVMTKYYNIGQDWQFSKQQKELLRQYYDANELLVECLNSDCYVSREVRQEIEDTLLLPIAEVEQRKAKSV